MTEMETCDRTQVLQNVTSATVDVLIIGGGIVGSGIARDAAMRGLRTAIVEQHDFAYGTSSRSSRLLHGGLRYLAQGRIGLVREASIEKRVVHGIAPHLAEPLAFVFPTYKGAPWAPWALWKLCIGVKLYDLLCGGRNLGKSTWFGARGMASHLRGVREDRLTGGVRYYDGLTQDSRLVMDTLRSAKKAGAMLVNYCRMVRAEEQPTGWRCLVRDRLTNAEHEIMCRTVVNATGPWAEQLDKSAVKLRLTKGVHLVIERDRLPIPDAVVMTEGSRILFAIPWGQRVILGTTDTDYTGPIEAVRTEPADTRYILEVVNSCFPGARLTTEDVISDWAGLRPLIADPNGRPSDISRSHEICSPHPGWWDVAGGKLTTYRLMAEQAVDRIEQFLGRAGTACQTAATPLLEPWETDGLSSIVPPPVTKEAVEHYCRHEWAIHLDDVMLRRTGWYYYHRDARQIARQVAGWMAEILGWDDARRCEEIRTCTGEAVPVARSPERAATDSRSATCRS